LIVESGESLTGAEILGATAVSWLASIVVFAYFVDWVGLTIAPFQILAGSIAAATALFIWLRHGAQWLAGEIAAFTGVVGLVVAWLLWLTWPDVLPPGGGSDLAHHLQLVDYIDRHWRLVHDPSVESYLGEMVHYTPGAHLLASLFGHWIGADGFHAVYPVVALAVAIKVGFVFLIARRTVPRPGSEGSGAEPTSKADTTTPFALAAVVLAFLPRAFVVGSFVRYSYIAQVVSELFAVTMWWALVVWDERPSAKALALFAISGAAAFLTWPVWIGPPLVAFAILVVTRADVSIAGKRNALAIGGLPIAIVAAVHAAGALGWVKIVSTGTDTPLPAWSDFTWGFLAASALGIIAVVFGRRGRVTALVIAACAFQAGALFAIAKLNGAVVPYMPIKMIYFAIYPLAVAGACAVATTWNAAVGATPAARASGRLAWALVAVLGLFVGRSVVRAPIQKPIVSESLYRAGQWARSHLEPTCVDYIVAHDNTSYWLHLSVLGNRRMSERTADDSTFITRDAIVRWIERGGLPYAVADLGTIPRDVLSNTDELARFGTAVVIKRRGESTCMP
jgi:hypothetical protein